MDPVFSPIIQHDRAMLVVPAFDTESCERLLRAIEELAGRVRVVELDLSRVEEPGTIAAATILEAIELGQRIGLEVALMRPSKQVSDLLRLYRLDRLLKIPRAAAEKPSLLEALGGHVIDTWTYARDLGFMFQVALYWGVLGPVRGRGIKFESVVQEMHKAGATAWPIVATIGALMGVVLGINAGYQLRWYGAYLYIADLVGVSITRELGPIMAAILVAGRSGSTIAAEIGTMKVTEEVDALRTMGLNPGKFLVAPRILGLAFTLPGLVLVCDTIAILGGLAVAVFGFGLTVHDYVDRTQQTLHVDDVLGGLVKALVFAVLIGVIACHEGFRVRGGAEDVGRATTAAVVRGILLVIVANAFFTWIFYIAKT
jgi:phospholipid/cholesterol/gamma-HCH transport system permease protein